MVDGTSLDAIMEQCVALRDLFQRRLMEDKAKNRLYEELHAQTDFMRNGVLRTYARPLFNELLLLIDRLSGLADDVVAVSVVAELSELLARRGVRGLPPTTVFDPRYHEAVRTEPSGSVPKGQIVKILRSGHLIDDVVLRPALVVVSTGPDVTPREFASRGEPSTGEDSPTQHGSDDIG